jgi:phosphonatase-like hydrolase
VIELAALDMAGTTIDEGGAVYVALRDAVAAEGVTVGDESLRRWMGTDKRAAVAGLLVDAGRPRPGAEDVERMYARFRDHLDAAYAEQPPRPIAGAPEAIAALRAGGTKVALTTGFSRDVVDPLLAGLGWAQGVVDAVVCVDDVPAGRPAPYLVFRAMERTGVVDVRRVLVAGDTPADLQSGANAGAALVVGVVSGAVPLDRLGHEPHTHLVDSVADLPALLASA